MITVFAAAAMLVTSDHAAVPVNVQGMDRAAAHAAVHAAAIQTCRAINPREPRFRCVSDATAEAMRRFDELRARRPVEVAERP